jgi:hypothetical protein
MLMRVILYGEKFALFTPEDNPAEEFYHDVTEILLGCDCSAANQNKPHISIYDRAYDWVANHIFYVYPKDLAPTPEYIKERFLELYVKEKISGCLH